MQKLKWSEKLVCVWFKKKKSIPVWFSFFSLSYIGYNQFNDTIKVGS